MRLIDKRSEKTFAAIKTISDTCFSGAELPTDETLRWHYKNDSVFIREKDGGWVYAFAIVEDMALPYIRAIAVMPTETGRGVGGSLLEEIANHFRVQGFTELDLMVNVNNPAQKLYFDHGFRPTRVLPKFYGETSGMRMRRVL